MYCERPLCPEQHQRLPMFTSLCLGSSALVCTYVCWFVGLFGLEVENNVAKYLGSVPETVVKEFMHLVSYYYLFYWEILEKSIGC